MIAAIRGKQEGNYDLYVMPAEGGNSDLLFRSSYHKAPTDWSSDGRYIFFNALGESTKWDVWAVSTIDRHAGPLLDTVNSERDAVLSPNGKWLAFDSVETGRLEVYVQAFSGISSDRRKRWKVSAGGGGTPKWSADGKELFYMTASGRVMATTVRATVDEFESETPVKLFQTRPIPRTWNLFEPPPRQPLPAEPAARMGKFVTDHGDDELDRKAQKLIPLRGIIRGLNHRRSIP